MSQPLNLPRTDTTDADCVEALWTLLHVISPKGRETIRAHLLRTSEVPEFAHLLRVMNDYERVRDHWRKTS